MITHSSAGAHSQAELGLWLDAFGVEIASLTPDLALPAAGDDFARTDLRLVELPPLA